MKNNQQPADRHVNETGEDLLRGTAALAPQFIKDGLWEGVGSKRAEGIAQLVLVEGTYFVRFPTDFMVTNGPGLELYFGKDGHYDKSAKIGSLKGNAGGQNYEVPARLNPKDYNEVWIWSQGLALPFGKAKLQ